MGWLIKTSKTQYFRVLIYSTTTFHIATGCGTSIKTISFYTDIKRYSLQVKRSGSRPTIVNEQDANGIFIFIDCPFTQLITNKKYTGLEDNYWMGDEDDSGFLEDGKIPADGTLFGWDRRKRFVSH